MGSRETPARAVVLAIDTATTTAVVALGSPGGESLAQESWRAGYRHGEELLARIDALLASRGLGIDDVAGIAVGIGPGAFTGLRVGLATAKGLAHALGCPLAGVSTGAALVAAAARAGGREPLALLLPAGPSDRVLVESGRPAVHLAHGAEPDLVPRTTLVAVDLEHRAPEDAVALGQRASAGLGAALLAIGAPRIAAGGDDLAAVVPEYVTLPRGVREQTGEVAWSRGRP